MIYLNINLRNPWSSVFKNIWHRAGETIFKHKYWEIQVIKSDNWFRFEFGFTIHQDHAGVNIELGLLSYEVHFTLYDNRHWNYEKNTWEVY
jgi:hypothetical protein